MTEPKAIEAWIDVGGTFTDCFVSTSGSTQDQLRRGKTLSSGRVPLSFEPTRSGRNFIHSRELELDCDAFWVGATLRCFDASGDEFWRRPVMGFTGGTLELESLPPTEFLQAPDTFHIELDPHCEAPVLAVRRLMQTPLLSSLPPLRVRLGTTKGTNALLTRGGAKTALAITAPLVDLLQIGDQTRPDLFALAVTKPKQLCDLSLAILERLDATGKVIRELDVDHALQTLLAAREEGAESLAICLMHAYLNPIHEQELEQIARRVGFSQISLSSRLAPVIELVARAQTTVVDAYLSPIVRDYLAKLMEEFGGASQVQMAVMTSAGGLIDWKDYSGKDSILSGPAGGVAALRGLSKSTGRTRLIGLDMGGTSTDVCRVTENQELQFESTKAGVRILTPTLPIETVASGGGSICWFDGVSLRVGPESAGAFPGPACYGRGGPLTITDVNFYLGRIPAKQFPFPISNEAVNARLDEIGHAITQAIGPMSSHEIAVGFRTIANEQMADAVRTVSIAQGADPRSHTLVGFGGAAGQHICEIAESLGVAEIIDSMDGGLLSALGMGLAVERLDAVVPVYQPLADCDWEAMRRAIVSEESRLESQLRQRCEAHAKITHDRALEVRYTGTDSPLTIPWTEPTSLIKKFELAHQRRFGYVRHQLAIEVVSARIACHTAERELLPASREAVIPQGMENDAGRVERSGPVPHRLRGDLLPGQQIDGPAIVLNAGSTLVIEPTWVARVQSDGTLVIRRTDESNTKNTNVAAEDSVSSSQNVDPVLRDCIGQRFSAIATQMGLMLQQTAVSVNVKQRRDFSCAVFDAAGRLLASAPHVPVHLGAMGETVRGVLREFPDICTGDVFVTNDPYKGGSHLPDVTVITPIFAGKTRVMLVANRAHHADIGGLTPGSMSVLARTLGDEGVVIAPRRLVSAGRDQSGELRKLLESAERPPRNIEENMADLAAQVAANVRGTELLSDYASTLTWEVLQAYGSHLLDAAELRVRQFLQRADSGQAMRFEDHLDDGTPIRVAMEIESDGTLNVDFTGTGGINSHNFNANPSIVSAAIMYVLRCLIADELPLNEGVLQCVNLVLPEGLLNPPAHHQNASLSPAVAAGNVETSQRVVDVLLGAFGAAAASQGTMNNLLFGNEQFGFYETICGGSGATRGQAGASAVHTHMTNTRLTDPEVLEARYPVRLVEFRRRVGSGGDGKWKGGDGVTRTIEFLESVEVSLLSSRRGEFPPFGLAGGNPGQIGQNTLIDLLGDRISLGACAQLTVQAGERIEIQTPGGGGFGHDSLPKEPT